MNVKKAVREIGFFETALNMEAAGLNASLQDKPEITLPFPSGNTRADCEELARWLLESDKRKYLLLTPEIALIEAMAKCADRDTEVILAVPCDLDPESEERLLNNLPRSIHVSVLKEPFFPDRFLPANGMIVACGYAAGAHLFVLPETYRMIEHYGGFMGHKVFAPYIRMNAAERFEGWIETSSSNFSEKWRLSR